MKEKRKIEKTQTGGGGDSVFDSVPALPESNVVSVSSGPYAEDLPVAGSTVTQVRQRFADRFDLDEGSQAVIDGKTLTDESYVLKAGESLMFIKHAGEKGGAKVVLEGDTATANNTTMKLSKLLPRLGPPISTGPVILPSGIKCVLSQGCITVWIWEKPPHIARLSWIRADSPIPYGRGARYRLVSIGLPYLIIGAVFVRDPHTGLPNLVLRDECFFRNEPLKSMNDELCYPGLLNCSKFVPPDGNPLSWICTQHLKPSKKMYSSDPGDRFQAGFEAVRYCLLETSFNLSSEHHEANSWYSEIKKVDARISTIERWEEETKKDPLFVLDVPWLSTGHTVRQLAERIFKINGQTAADISSAGDVAKIIANG